MRRQKIRYCPKCASTLDVKIIDGVERKACSAPACGFVYWNNPIPVVAALVEYQGQIVLARNAKWSPGVFSLITGFLEQDEHPEHAVAREVAEELGLEGKLTRFIGHYPFPQMNQIIMAFSVSADGELRTNHELAETKLVPTEQLGSYDFGPLYITAAVVGDWLRRTG